MSDLKHKFEGLSMGSCWVFWNNDGSDWQIIEVCRYWDGIYARYLDWDDDFHIPVTKDFPNGPRIFSPDELIKDNR